MVRNVPPVTGNPISKHPSASPRTDSATSMSGVTTDTEIMTALIALQDEKNVEASALAVLPQLEGAFSLVFMDEHTLYAARDRHGVRPLVLGKLETGWVVASESAGLDIVGAAFVREIEPGEFIAIDQDGLRAHPSARTCGAVATVTNC